MLKSMLHGWVHIRLAEAGRSVRVEEEQVQRVEQGNVITQMEHRWLGIARGETSTTCSHREAQSRPAFNAVAPAAIMLGMRRQQNYASSTSSRELT